jgi:drug/metabolite transporter (DMT)-like permease
MVSKIVAGYKMNSTTEQSSSQNLLLGTLLLVSAFGIGAIQNAVVKVIGDQAPTSMVVASQYLICFLCISPMIVKSKFKVFKTKRIGMILLRSISGAGYFAGMFFAVKFISLMDVSLLSSTGPIWITLLTLVFLRKKVAGLIIMGAIVGFVGIALILNPNSAVFSFGGLIALVAGLSAGIAMMSVASVAKTEDPSCVMSYYFLFNTLLPIPLILVSWETPTAYIALLLLINGVLMFVHQVCLIKGFRHGPASRLGSTLYASVIFSGLIGWFFWNEIPTIYSLLGALLVVLGGVMTITLGKKVS